MKKTIITIAAIAISLSSFAQSELSGKWSFQEQESISGNLYSNGSPKTIKISVNGSAVIFEATTATASGTDATTRDTLKLNGAAFQTFTPSKRKKVISIKKAGSSYTVFTTVYNAAEPTKVDHKVTDTWSIENGQLMLDRKDENLTNGEVWESKASYSKQ